MIAAARWAFATSLAVAFAAFAQAPAKPRTYALISGIGPDITYVRQVKGTGSHIPPYRRFPLHVADGSVDAAVLRGLDRALAQEEPDSKRVFLRVDPRALKDIAPHQRGDVISGRVLADLAAIAERSEWDRIILVTPGFAPVGSDSMGDRLHGVGIYVQPLGRNRTGFTDSDIETGFDPETVSPTDGKRDRSYKFVAPYFYVDVWIIDARTLQVLERKQRRDFIRLYDPEANTVDIANSIPPQLLADNFNRFVERASAKALNEAVGEVIVNEPRIVSPATK